LILTPSYWRDPFASRRDLAWEHPERIRQEALSAGFEGKSIARSLARKPGSATTVPKQHFWAPMCRVFQTPFIAANGNRVACDGHCSCGVAGGGEAMMGREPGMIFRPFKWFASRSEKRSDREKDG